MPFGLANAGIVYSRMLEVAIKEVDRDFWTSYLDNILTYSGEPWAHFGHLTQVVLAHMKAGIKIQPCKTMLLFQSKVESLGYKICFYDPGICTENQWRAQDGEGSVYVLGIHRILQNLQTPVFSTDKPVEQD